MAVAARCSRRRSQIVDSWRHRRRWGWILKCCVGAGICRRVATACGCWQLIQVLEGCTVIVRASADIDVGIKVVPVFTGRVGVSVWRIVVCEAHEPRRPRLAAGRMRRCQPTWMLRASGLPPRIGGHHVRARAVREMVPLSGQQRVSMHRRALPRPIILGIDVIRDCRGYIPG